MSVIAAAVIVAGLVVTIGLVRFVHRDPDAVVTHTVQYRATSNEKAVRVLYDAYRSGSPRPVEATSAGTFAKTVTFTRRGALDLADLTMTARSETGSDAASVSCTVVIDGRTRAHDARTGAYADAACFATD